MNTKELTEIILKGESEFVEFKSTGKIQIETLGKMIVSFLNGKGGIIILGVKEPNEVTGLKEEEIARLKDFTIGMARNKIRPSVNFKYDVISIDGKNLIVIEIDEGKFKPYGFFGKYYIREGHDIIEMGQTNIIDFYNTKEKYDQRTVTEILEKVNAIELTLRDKFQMKSGTNIFVSHGFNPNIREKIVEFLESLGLNPIVVKDSASGGLSIDDKVEKYIKRSSAAIILFTPDDELKDGTYHPRQNVIHETGLLQRIMPEKIIYLKEKRVNLPSNITPRVYIPFENEDLTDAFIHMVKELKTFEIL